MSPEQYIWLLISAAAAPDRPKPEWIQALDAIGDFIGNAGWPLALILALILFREPIQRIRSVGWKDWKIEIGRQLEQAGMLAKQDLTGRPTAPTAEEVAKSGEIGKLASSVDVEQVRRTAIELAGEYVRVRASMSGGHERTRKMEIVVSKMRAFGRAVIPLRDELRSSVSPGQRLVAIASYQVAPDYEALEWLVERLSEEKPFVGYHAAVALLVAARDPRARESLPHLENAVKLLAKVEEQLRPDSDRNQTLQEFKAQVGSLAGLDQS
jgi:hypothetical protein